MQDPQKLLEENERLKAELAAYKDAEKAQKQKRGRFIKRLGSWGSWFFLGGDLKQSIKKLVIEVRDKDKQLSNDTLGDVLAHGAWRFTRIGCFALLITTIPLLVLIIQTSLLYFQNELIDIQITQTQNQNILLEKQEEQQTKRLDQQTYLQEATRRSNSLSLFGNIMDALDMELKEDYLNDSLRNLSPQLKGRVIALSTILKPYKYLDADTLIGTPLSPERGQLLINILESQLDNSTYKSIIKKADFSYADLNNFQMQGVYLARTLLKNANLKGCYLSQANLEGANLKNTNLEGAILEYTSLIATNLKESNLKKVRLCYANLKGANLKNANLRNSDLKGANLEGANLSYTNLDGANLTGANMNNVMVNSLDFLDNLSKWKVFGKEEILTKYYVNTTLHNPARFGIEPFYEIKQK